MRYDGLVANERYVDSHAMEAAGAIFDILFCIQQVAHPATIVPQTKYCVFFVKELEILLVIDVRACFYSCEIVS